MDIMFGQTYWFRKAKRYRMTTRTDLGLVRRILRMYSALSYRLSTPTVGKQVYNVRKTNSASSQWILRWQQ